MSLPSPFATPKVVRRDGPDGTIYLDSCYDLPISARCPVDWFTHWAEIRPDTVFVAERDLAGGWSNLTYSDLLLHILGISGWLLENGARSDHPVVILSENSIDHAVLAFSAIFTHVPVATIPTAYSLLSSDDAKLIPMVEFLDPALIFVSDLGTYAAALNAVQSLLNAQILTSAADDATTINHTLLADATLPEASSEDAAAALADVLAHPDTTCQIAKGVAALKASGGGSSRYAPRARFLMAPPSPDRGEITNKACLNQHQCLSDRADDINALYGDDPTAYIAERMP